MLTLPSGAPLRNPETGDIIGDSPLMSSLIVIISATFLAAGLAFGRATGTIKGSEDALGMITKSWASLASLLFLFLLIAQFIAYFDFSNIAQVVAITLGDILEDLNVANIFLLLGIIVVTMVVDIIMPAKIAKWAILAPIFIPLMLRLGVEPQTVLAAYRVGDSPVNVITPLMPYFPLMVVFAARYQKDAGIGTVIALMVPYAIVVAVFWIAFFVLWYFVGHPARAGLAGLAPAASGRSRAPWTTPRSRSSSWASRSRCSCGTGCRSASSRSARRWRSTATDVISVDQAFAGFGDPTVIFIASLFVVSEALDATGRDDLGRAAAGRRGRVERRAARHLRLAAGGRPVGDPDAQRRGRRAAADDRARRDAARAARRRSC